MVLLFVSGCSVNRQQVTNDFVDFYNQAISSTVQQKYVSDYNDETITISADTMPLSSFIRSIAQMCQVSIVCDQKLDKSSVTIDVTNQPVSEVLSVVARRLGVSLTRSGDLFFLGEVKPEDRGVYVRKVKRALAADLRDTIQILRSENGRGVVYDDGLVVVGDRVELLRRLDDMFNQIEQSPVGSWSVQLFVISVSDSFYSDMGLDSSFSADMSYNLLKASSDVHSSLALSGALSGILKADTGDGRVQSITKPTFLIQDGSEAVYHSGQTFKVPVKAVSDSGTVTTTGYQDIDSGLQLSIKLVDYGSERVQLTVDLVNSAIVGYNNDGYPHLSSDKFSSTSIVQSGQTLLLGSFLSDGLDESVSGLFSLSKSKQSKQREFLLWARCYKVL